MEILQYSFMRRAFVVGILLAIIMPLIGVIIVFKRLSMIGDALSHSSLAGVAAGLVLGINPIVGSIIACFLAAFGVEYIRKKTDEFSELAIAIMMSLSIGVAGILSGFVKNASSFQSLLFGSIVAIEDLELLFIIVISVIVVLVFIRIYNQLFCISLDENSARILGVSVKKINFIFTVITALTISISSKTVGVLVVSSMMIVPVASAMQISKSYKQTTILSVIFAEVFVITGLILSYYLNLKPGGTIVTFGVVIFFVILLLKKIFSIKKRKKSGI